MLVKIEIPDTQLNLLKDVYGKKYTELTDSAKAIHKEIEEMKPLLLQLGIIAAPKNDSEIIAKKNGTIEVYNVEWGWLDKCMFVMRKHGACTPQEIAEILVKTYDTTLDKDVILNSIPATLSVEARKLEGAKVIRFKREGEREYVYDIKE